YRTGCKLAVIDESGAFVAKDVIYPHKPVNKKEEAKKKILELIEKHDVTLVAIGNGTALRESVVFIGSLIKEYQLDLPYIIFNDVVGSVYSASTIAREEFTDINIVHNNYVYND